MPFSQNKKIRILIADDHPVVRSGLRMMFEMEPKIKILGEAEDGLQAIEAVRRLGPDIILLDVNLPKMHGREVAEEISGNFPKTRVIALTMHKSPTYMAQLRKAGAHGYLVKESPIEELMHAICLVHAGGTYFAPLELEQPSDSLGGRGVMELTNREVELLQLLAAGRSNKEISGSLGLSVRTVEKHRDNLFSKTNTNNMAGLTRFAILNGYTDLAGDGN